MDNVNPNADSHKIISCQVQTQKGASACGLFALAFLTALIFGFDQSALEFDQDAMVNHYNNIINSNNYVDFFHFNFMFPFQEKKRCNIYNTVEIN